MRIRHIFPTTSSRKEVDGDRAFLLSNKEKDLFSLYTTPQTRYEGWYTLHGLDPYLKLLDRITVNDPEATVSGLTNTGNTVFSEYTTGLRIGYKLLPSQPGLTISLSAPTSLNLIFDIRSIYAYPTFGRTYTITPKSKGYLVSYTDPTLTEPIFVHIRSQGDFTLKQEWQLESYPRDEQRHSPPQELHVFNLTELKCNSVAFGYGNTPEEAEKISLAAFKQKIGPPNVGINYTHDTLLNEVTAAKIMSQQSLQLLQTDQGIWAGLPWFHQIWSRDELITALGVDKEWQKRIIDRYLSYPLEEGELPTFQGSKTTCADGVGWLALLVREYGLENFTDQEREYLTMFLKIAKEQLDQFRRAGHGLIYSGFNATWMDTIGRVGYRLEIQCMYALVLELLAELTSDPRLEQTRIRFLGRIKQEFWSHGYLQDGLSDPALRPNLFLAYLIQPDLLTEQLWQGCFEKALKELRTPWNGLRTLTADHPKYEPLSTGEDNKSYHEGDSWFFINNLAAIALLRFNQHRYGKTIVAILQSSTEEILWQQVIGHPSEISSAEVADSFGCHTQAWSAGTYLALLKEFEDYSSRHEADSIASFWDSSAESLAI